MSIVDQGEVNQINQNVPNSSSSLQEQLEKSLKSAIFNAEKPLSSCNIKETDSIKHAENRRFSFNSDGKSKNLFKISSANSEKKEKPENIGNKEKEENSSDMEKNLQNEEFSYDENLDEIINANNKESLNKEAKLSASKIFTTTIIEKNKKAINFKVIKNRERYNSTNTVNSVNINSIASNNNSNNNTACNTNALNNPLSSILNPFVNNVNENNYNNNNEIINNNFSSDVNLKNYINSNSTSSNSVVVNNLSSISNLNVNSNINLNNINNSKINFNNSINTQNSDSNCNLLNNMEEINFYNKNNPSSKVVTSPKSNQNETNEVNLNAEKNNITKSLSENQTENALIENKNNFKINNNLNNSNMKNSKMNMGTVKQQVFDLNNISTPNNYVNGNDNYNYTIKNMQNQAQAVSGSNMNSQMQFFGNANPQEFFNDTNTQALGNNSNMANQNVRNYAQQNYSSYQSQNFAFYEKENLAATAAQNFNNFNDYFPNAENFGKKRNKENDENLNFNSLYLNSASYGNGVAIRQQQSHNLYSNSVQPNYINPYGHQFNANVPYGIPGINPAYNGNAIGMGLIGMNSPGRKPLRCKDNYIDELLVAVEECINRGIYKENNSPSNKVNSSDRHNPKAKNSISELNKHLNAMKNNDNNHNNPFSTNNQNNEFNENENNSFKNNNDSKPKQAVINKNSSNKEEKDDDNSFSNKLNDEKSKINLNNNNIKSNNNDDSSICLNSEKINNQRISPLNECSKLKKNLMNNLDTLSNNLNLDLNENNKSIQDDDLNLSASSKHSKNDKSSIKKNEESFIDFSSCKENKKGNNHQSSLNNNVRGNLKQRESNTTKCENKYCQFDVNSKKKIIISKKKIGSKSLLVCQNCLKAYNNGKYCRWCYTTYKENTNAHEDGKDWVQCDADNCISWHHIHCEERKGNYSNLFASLKDKDFKYYCPDCKPKFDNNTPITKSKKIAANDSFLKKKRSAVKSNSLHNVYRKEYDFAFKHSKSKRIKEKMKMLEKIKDNKDKPTDKELDNSPSNPNTRNFTSLGRTDKNRNNPSLLRDGELIKRSRTKNKGSSKSLNYNSGNNFINFNDLFVYDQRLKTKRNRADSYLEDEAKEIGNDIKKLNDKLNKEN